MKGNLIDEKEKQGKGVAVRERSTLETTKCRAGPSERHGGISGAFFDEEKFETHTLLLHWRIKVMIPDNIYYESTKRQP